MELTGRKRTIGALYPVLKVLYKLVDASVNGFSNLWEMRQRHLQAALTIIITEIAKT